MNINNLQTQICDSVSNFIAKEKIRQKAIEFCIDSNIPTKKHEQWKYINLKPIFETNYTAQNVEKIDSNTIAKFKIPKLKANILVFIDNCFSSEFSCQVKTPDRWGAKISDKLETKTSDILETKTSDILETKTSDKHSSNKWGSLARALEKNPDLINRLNNSTGIYSENIFAGINAIHSTDGCFIDIAPQSIIEDPLHILNITTGNNPIIQQKNLILIGQNSQVKIIESYHSIAKNATFTNVATEIIANENSNIDFYRLQQESNNAFQINNTKIIQQSNSNFSCNIFTFGGNIVRNNMIVDVIGENCQTEINGLYLPQGNQHFDNYTYINHAKPHCQSSQIFKGIADNKATSSYFGIVYVAKDAQKIEAYQSNKNILLSDTTKAHSRPQLEIYADDVKCSHGSTTGQLDEEALFYLQTRGLNRKKATALLLYAFAADIIEKIKIEPLRLIIDDFRLMIFNYG